MNKRNGNWLTVAIGVIFLIAGLIWGITGTTEVSYENLQHVSYKIGVGTDSGNVYINAQGSSEYFVALKSDFNPAISQSDIDNTASQSFIARTDTTSINLDVNGTTISEAHQIEKLVLYDQSGNTIATYTTAEYLANPNGVMANSWSQAIWIVVLGLLLTVGGIFSVLRAPKTTFSIGGTSTPPYQPPAQPSPSANPYAQAYQGPEQYPQPNPYQQPPQS